MERKNMFSHDAIDAFVATVLGWCERRFVRSAGAGGEVAFTDEWERNQIARELHWN